jgi:hypothetical protein
MMYGQGVSEESSSTVELLIVEIIWIFRPVLTVEEYQVLKS